jgi:dienelactone hydrolase
MTALPCGAQNAPRFDLSADTVLIDEVINIRVTGLPPKQPVTIRMAGDGAVRMQSSAAFRSNEQGHVDVAKMRPISGDYEGVHAMGLFWSASRDTTASPLGSQMPRRLDPRTPPMQRVILTAEWEGRVLATDTIVRRVAAVGVRIEEVRERGLVGLVLYPPGEGPHPAVIVLPGSQGGVPQLARFPAGLASQGYVVLALGYFAAEGLPERLFNIPLEYFETAITWLRDQPQVDSTRIGVLGISRGGELALLLGSKFPALRTVIAYVPSHVAWQGMQVDARRTPAWTYQGQPIPFMTARATPQAIARHAGCINARACSPRSIHQFRALLDDRKAEARAEIAVERINGGVLFVSGADDQVWPSELMADRAVARLKRHNFLHPYVHLKYKDAGHMITRPHVPTKTVTEFNRHPISGVMTTPGGTPEGTAVANEDSWRRMLEFLEKNLKLKT